VRLRFNRKLEGSQFVKNVKNKTIDGVVGARYRYLSNADFYARVAQNYQSSGVRFLSAYLYGRDLVIRYVTAPSLRTTYDLLGHTYLAGFQFANTEIGGRSIRVAQALIREGTNYCALGPYKDSGGRVVHTGNKFEKRLSLLLSGTLTKLPSQSAMLKGAEALEAQNLQLGNDPDFKHAKHLVAIMRRRKLSQAYYRLYEIQGQERPGEPFGPTTRRA
jgi:hypothetical protein